MPSNFLKLSTDLQCELIADLARGQDLSHLIGRITKQADRGSEVLSADACSIYIVDDVLGRSDAQKATMRAASGYQDRFIGVAECRVLTPDKVPDEPCKEEKLGITGWVISTGRAFLARSAQDMAEHPHWSGSFDTLQLPEQKAKVATFLAVPLRNLRGRIIGALKAERLEPCKAFSIQDQLVLETLARVTGRSIDYVAERRNSLDAAITLWAREVIAEAVATEGELDAFLDIVVRVVAAAEEADSASIFLVDENRKTLTQRAGSGYQVLRKVVRSYSMPSHAQVERCLGARTCDPQRCALRKPQLSPRVGLTAWMVATGKSFHAANMAELRAHCHHQGVFDKVNFIEGEQIGAWLGVPLRVGGAITGALKVENASPTSTADTRDFGEQHQRRLNLLAQEAALAIERLKTQYRARYEIIEKAMPTILELLSGELDVRALVEKVVRETAALFHARACALFLRQGNELVQPDWAAVGYARIHQPAASTDTAAMQAVPRVRKYRLVNADQIVENPASEQKVGLTVWIAVTGRKFTAKSYLELTSHPHHKGTYDSLNFSLGERCESFMGVPLWSAGAVAGRRELLGVLKVETKKRGTPPDEEFSYFNEQDELAFELIANSAAIAIQNARLLESRRLADKILLSPSLDAVVEVLHEALKDHEEGVSTLEGAAVIVGPKDRVKEEITQSFAASLDPECPVTILEQLVQRLNPPLRNLLSAMAEAIRCRSIGEITGILGRNQVQIAAVLRGDFFLRPAADLFINAVRDAGERIERYRRDPHRRAALNECEEVLREASVNLADLGLFERGILGRAFGQWSRLVHDCLSEFHEIAIPYVAGIPLDPASPVFVGREGIFDWIERRLFGGQKVALVLHGEYHAGKSSILKQLEAGPHGREIREGGPCPVYPVLVDLQALADPGMSPLFLGIAERITKVLLSRGVPCPAPRAEDFGSPARAFRNFLSEATRLVSGPPLGLIVIMLDEFELLSVRAREGKIDPEVFNYLRSLMQHEEGVSFIVAGRRRLDKIEAETKSRIFNVSQHQEVGFLSSMEGEQLIREPVSAAGVTYQDQVVRRILALTGGHPYLIQQLCFFCIEELNARRQDFEVDPEHLEQAVERMLSPSYVGFFADIWNSVGREAQTVLMRLARRASEAEPWVALSVLRDERGAPMTQRPVADVLNELALDYLIVGDDRAPDRGPRFRFNVDLMRMWLARRVD